MLFVRLGLMWEPVAPPDLQLPLKSEQSVRPSAKSSSVWVDCRAAQEPYIASMGIYVLKASAIRQLLNESFPDVRHCTAATAPCEWHAWQTQMKTR